MARLQSFSSTKAAIHISFSSLVFLSYDRGKPNLSLQVRRPENAAKQRSEGELVLKEVGPRVPVRAHVPVLAGQVVPLSRGTAALACIAAVHACNSQDGR